MAETEIPGPGQVKRVTYASGEVELVTSDFFHLSTNGDLVFANQGPHATQQIILIVAKGYWDKVELCQQG